MQQGAYQRKRHPARRRRSRKPTLLMMALAIALGAVVGSTVAYLFTNTDAMTNTFSPAHVTCEVAEDFNGSVKSNVKIRNTGDIDAFIRATVVVTWQDSAGNVHPTAPVAGTDYTVSFPQNTGWVKNGNYYYYTSAVAPNKLTGVLFTDCKPVEGKAPAGYHLSVEILASAIQSVPENVAEDVWGVDPTTLGGNGE